MKIIPWDDLVFTNRNRSYGAYVLRKEYPTALIASFVFMLVVMSLLFATSPFVYKYLKTLPPAIRSSEGLYSPSGRLQINLHRNKRNRRRLSQDTSVQLLPGLSTNLLPMRRPAIVESQNTSAETTPSQPVSVEVSTVAQSVVPETEDPNRDWTNVEQAPEFPGGMSAMMKFIGKNTRVSRVSS
ncbi:MAG: hypothetical protein WDO15_29465 [Bacteroidota bacterium]